MTSSRETAESRYTKTSLDFISGLIPAWISSTQISLSSGVAWVPGAKKNIILGSALQISASSLIANSWYYIYLYDNSGAASAEISLSAPSVRYFGSARTKDGDVSRRFIFSFKTGSSGNIYNFIISGQMVCYRENISASPFRVLAAGTSTSPSSVSVSSVVPLTTQVCRLAVTNASNVNGLSVTTPDTPSFGLITAGMGSKAYADFFTDASQMISYNFIAGAPTSSGAFVDITGYGADR